MPKYTPKFKPGDKRQVTFYISREVYERFQAKYPNTATTFFNKSVRLALEDRDFFTKVFFADIF